MAAPGSVVVMAGGPSEEREVSLRSGAAVARALGQLGYKVVQLDPVPGRWTLPGDVGVVFLALHGAYGEDGSIQLELEQLGVPYTGCGVEASRVAFDKILTKQKCKPAGVPLAADGVVRSVEDALPGNLSLPVVLKPARQGSSVGLQFINRMEEWRDGLREALKFGTDVLVEERVAGRETTVAILDGKALPIVEVAPKSGAYDYVNKYTPGRTDYLCPAPFSEQTTQAIQNAALGAYRAVGCRDYARVDVMVRADGSPVVLEVNTLPGMTETSLFPKAAAASGLAFGGLCEVMLKMALDRRAGGA